MSSIASAYRSNVARSAATPMPRSRSSGYSSASSPRGTCSLTPNV